MNIHQNMQSIFYRKYNCSIEAPNFKGKSITSPSSQVIQTTGTDNVFTVIHRISTSNCSFLSKPTFTGTLTIYLYDNLNLYSHVVMAVVNKTYTSNSITVYQKVGNLSSVTVVASNNVYTVNTSVETNLHWSYVGV